MQTESMLAMPQTDFTFEGIGYKENCNVPIIEESQKLHIAAALARAGRKVTVKDNDGLILAVQQQVRNTHASLTPTSPFIPLVILVIDFLRVDDGDDDQVPIAIKHVVLKMKCVAVRETLQLRVIGSWRLCATTPQLCDRC
jgi:hypothetical protein